MAEIHIHRMMNTDDDDDDDANGGGEILRCVTAAHKHKDTVPIAEL